MAHQPVLLELKDGLATLWLNRPHSLNGIDVELARALRGQLDKVSGREDVRALLIRGKGRAFCAGGDLAAFGDAADAQDVTSRTIGEFHPAIEALVKLEIPTIAGVHGAAAGAGFSLLLACDFAVAAANTRFTLAYSKIGATLDGGASWLLPKVVGLRKAKELAILSPIIDAEAAHQLGLVTKVVPDAEFDQAADEFARKLAIGPTLAYSRIKRLLERPADTPLEMQLDSEQTAFREIAATSDFREGLAAFMEKREPGFVGK